MMADSLSLLGGTVVSMMACLSGLVIQSSLNPIWAPAPLNRVSVGSLKAPFTPKLASDGPIARTRTFLGASPGTMNPPMRTLSPVWTVPRVERLTRVLPVGGSGSRVIRNVHITATDCDRLGREIPEPTGGEVFRFAGQTPWLVIVIGRERGHSMCIREGETDVELIIQGVSQRELDARTRRAILVLHRDVNMARGPDRFEGHPGKILSFRQGDGQGFNEDQVLMGRSRPEAGRRTRRRRSDRH